VKTNHLLMLIIVAAMLVGLAAWSSKSRRAAPPSDVGKPVLAGLNVNDIRRIELNKGGQAVVVAHNGESWSVTNLFGYPADFKKIRQNLLTLKDMKIGDVERGMKFADKDVTLVDLQDAKGKPLATLRLGPKRQKAATGGMGWSMPDGRYVARDGSDTVFLVKDALEPFDPEAKEWVDADLFNVPSSDIAMIEMTAPDGQTVKLDRTGGTLKIEGLTEKEEFDSSKGYGVESALSYLRFAGVANPALTAVETGLNTAHVYRVSLKTGESYTAQVGAAAPGGSERYTRFTVGLAPATTNDAARAAQEQKVTEQNGNLSRWTFLISSYTAENMARTRAELVKAKPASTNAVDSATDKK
jgi:hypothetical protein